MFKKYSNKYMLKIGLGATIFILIFGISYTFYNYRIQKMSQSSIKYKISNQIDKDNIQNALDTSVGSVGIDNVDVEAISPVKSEFLNGDYMYVSVNHERYTMHTRTVTETDSKGHTTTRIEIYWQWDDVGTKKDYSNEVSLNGFNVKYEDLDVKKKLMYLDKDKVNLNKKEVKFLGMTFSSSNTIEGNYLYTDSNNRYEFYYVPSKFTAKSIFAKLDNSILPFDKKIEIHDKSVKEVKKESQLSLGKSISHQFPVSIIVALLGLILSQIVLYDVIK